MPTRDRAPLGSPCWVDLWTSDVEGSRAFYGDLFGWEAGDPSPEFGGYFMFLRDGVPVAGGMGDMGDMPATDTWQIYLDTPDLAVTLAAAQAAGAQVIGESTPIDDLGVLAVLADPTGAVVGAWQAGTFPGYTVVGEHGSPSWSELWTSDHGAAVDFYRTVFRWDANAVGDTDEFRYTTMRDPDGDGELAGIMDASSFLPEGVGSHWSIYWEVDDADAALARVTSLGGSVVAAVEDTPYGRLATAADPSGASFRMRQSTT
jgi:uncharacterized protein